MFTRRPNIGWPRPRRLRKINGECCHDKLWLLFPTAVTGAVPLNSRDASTQADTHVKGEREAVGRVVCENLGLAQRKWVVDKTSCGEWLDWWPIDSNRLSGVVIISVSHSRCVPLFIYSINVADHFLTDYNGEVVAFYVWPFIVISTVCGRGKLTSYFLRDRVTFRGFVVGYLFYVSPVYIFKGALNRLYTKENRTEEERLRD